MQAHPLREGTLTLPEALMSVLHDKKGHVYRGVPPDALTAAAELIELKISGQVAFYNNMVFPDQTSRPAPRPWMDEAREEVPATGIAIDWWITQRRGAISREEALAQSLGVLRQEPNRLFGLFSYDRFYVVAHVRNTIVADLLDPMAQSRERTAELARLIVKGHLVPTLGLPAKQNAAIESLATHGVGPGSPRSGSNDIDIDLAVAAVIYGTVTGW